jgi:hypothetical protein
MRRRSSSAACREHLTFICLSGIVASLPIEDLDVGLGMAWNVRGDGKRLAIL